MSKIAALMPMRHGSERIKGKNYRLFGDRPLYQHMLDCLVSSELIDVVVIDTDSQIISEQVSAKYPDVVLLERPSYLTAGTVPMNDVLLHDVSNVEADFYLQTHSTNPLLTLESLESAIKIFLENYPMYDSLFTVTRLQTRLWDELARPINHNSSILLRTQDLPPIYEENSCLYIFSKEILKRKHNRIGDRPYLYSLPPDEAWDIDEEIDFQIAEMIYKHNLGIAT
ncbi:MAG: acylneuraminate cytidylyltransferase family protein [Chloroflexota bacterium]